MSKLKTSEIIQLIAGILVFAIGAAVFAVRLRHEGPYAMPHGGPMLAGIGAIVLGVFLMWTGKPKWTGWIVLVLSPAALFPCAYSIMGEWEEVVSLYAFDAEGQETDLRLWIVDREDGEWVGMSRDKAVAYSLDGAQLRMLRDGEVRCVTPVLTEDQEKTRMVHAMKVEKYATAQFAADVGLYPREATENTAALRLDPCSVVANAEQYRHAQEAIGTVREVYDGTLFPDIQVNTFRNIDRLFPTREVKPGEHVLSLPPARNQLQNFRFESGGRTYDLYDFLSLNRVAGLVVVKDGQIAFEKYLLGNDETTRWMSMSVVKSITATLVGLAIKDGHIDSIDDPLTEYVSELRGSAYDGVTVRQLLHMTSGVAWNETYTDPGSDRRAMLEAQIAQEPGAIMEVMAGLDRAAEPGTRWNYSTGETQVVGALVAAATGKHVADYLSEKIWIPASMESTANWWLDSPDGLEIGGSGLSATLRDYARFGLFLLNEGRVNGKSTLPDGWIEEATRPQVINGETIDYGYMLWLGDGAYSAVGIFGQYVTVVPEERLVIAMWSALPKPVGMAVISPMDFFSAIGRELDQ